MEVSAVVLAAGQGTRMQFQLPKVLHPILGKPLVWYSSRGGFSGRGNEAIDGDWAWSREGAQKPWAMRRSLSYRTSNWAPGMP